MNSSKKDLRYLNPSDICIVAYGRTPTGSFGGSLSSIHASELASHAIKHCLLQCVSEIKNQNDLSHIEEAFLGNVLSANLGQAPARQAVLKAGLSESVICTTINKVCASGMKSVIFGCQQLQLKQRNKLILCGGMENMSQVPYYSTDLRFGKKMQNSVLIDGMVKDGLWDVYNNFHMGMCAEGCAKKFEISREQQDEFAVRSFKNAMETHKAGIFKKEISPINIKGKIIDNDEGCWKLDEKKLKNLKPAFSNSNLATVTAGSSSSISDGAAIIMLCTGEYAMKHNLNVHAVIVSYDDAEIKPIDFPIAPFEAIKKTLERAHLSVEDIDFWEINEAFAIVCLANMKLLKMDKEQMNKKLNIFGGAISLGHPLGCSGARIICTLINVLTTKQGKYGCAAICNGGGGASCMIFERVNYNNAKANL